MGEKIIVAKMALAMADGTGFALSLKAENGERTLVTLDTDTMQKLLISLLRGAHFANPLTGMVSDAGASPLQTVPCGLLRLLGTESGSWLLYAKVGDLELPLELEQPAMIHLARTVARSNLATRASAAPALRAD